MTNLTVSLDAAVVRKARVRAIQEGTSLSAKVREFLEQYSADSSENEAQLRRKATERLLQSLEQARQGAQPQLVAKRKSGTLRDELYRGDFRSRARKA